jgi:hypothetical protein
MRRAFDEAEYSRSRPRPDEGTAGLGLFDTTPSAPAWVQSWGTLTVAQQHAQRERWKEQLRPRVVELARKSGPEGIIAADVISDGITSGVLWGERVFLTKYPRIYAFVGLWLAELAVGGVLEALTVRTDNGATFQVRRESTRAISKGNLGKVYVTGRAA